MPIEIITTLEDRRGKQSTTSAWLSDATPDNHVQIFAGAWGAAIDAFVLGVIRGITAVYRITGLNALLNNVMGASSDVEEIGAFEFVTAQGNRVKFNIPAINELLVVNETGDLDLTEPAIANIITAFEDGLQVGPTLVTFCDIGEDDIVGTLFARERSKNSGKRRTS